MNRKIVSPSALMTSLLMAGQLMTGLLIATLLMSNSLRAESITANDSRISLMGRAQQQDDGSLRFAYPGVSLFLNIEGAALAMTAHSNTGNGWVDVTVDDSAPKRIQLAQQSKNYELFRFAQPGKHKVRITHRTETWQGITTIRGFIADKGQLLAASPLPLPVGPWQAAQ